MIDSADAMERLIEASHGIAEQIRACACAAGGHLCSPSKMSDRCAADAKKAEGVVYARNERRVCP
jgi:hypothetical protein